MTTAARPTFEPARGGTGKGERGTSDLSALSKQYSARDLPGHTRIKYRQEGQSSAAELMMRDFRKDLEEKERAARDKKLTSGSTVSTTARAITARDAPAAKRSRTDYSHHSRSGEASISNLDADDPVDDEEDEDDRDVRLLVKDSDDDSDDETAQLMAELNRIKSERAAEAAQKEAERRAEEKRIRTENILKDNPLLPGGLHNVQAAAAATDFKVKRRWDADVVFKNCARPQDKKDGFVNDVLRSEFHKRFMDRYIK